MYPPPPPPPPIVYIWCHIFAGPKRNFEKNKRKQTLLWNSNSCDKFSQYQPNRTILIKIHIHKFHNFDQNSQFRSVWCGGLETAGGGGRVTPSAPSVGRYPKSKIRLPSPPLL